MFYTMVFVNIFMFFKCLLGIFSTSVENFRNISNAILSFKDPVLIIYHLGVRCCRVLSGNPVFKLFKVVNI